MDTVQTANRQRKVSDYIIYVPLTETGEYMLLHGYNGSIDVISKDIYDLLVKSKQDNSKLNELKKEDLETLEQRGYVTTKTTPEEQEFFTKITKRIDTFSKERFFSISVIPTYSCNFRCPYCYAGEVLEGVEESSRKVMDFKMVDSIFKFIQLQREKSKKIKGIGLCGGEPLLGENYPIIEYLVHKARENDIKISAITNGYDLDNYIGLLGKEGIKSLQISIDGLRECHDSRRFLIGKKPTFDKIISNIDECLKKDVKISVRSNIDKNNIDQIGGLLSFFKEKGWLEKSNFSHYFKGINQYNETGNLEVDFNDIKLMEKIRENELFYSDYQYNNMYSHIGEMIREALETGRFPSIKASHCALPANGAVIDPDGMVYPCLELIGQEEQIIGELKPDGEMVFNEDADRWRSCTVFNNVECVKCAYAMYCGGGCPVHAMEQDGYQKAYECRIFKKVFKEVVPEIYQNYVKEKTKKIS